MGKKDSDSDDDIRNYLPDLPAIMKYADPAYTDRINREAMNNPELDVALDERRRGLEALDRAAGPQQRDVPRTSAPSPWAREAGALRIDDAALPSANAPRAPASPSAPEAQRAPARRARPLLPRWIYALAVAILASPLLTWLVVANVGGRHAVGTAASAVRSAGAIATTSATGAMETPGVGHPAARPGAGGDELGASSDAPSDAAATPSAPSSRPSARPSPAPDAGPGVGLRPEIF